MKTIMIETVVNGWIVRPFTPCQEWTHQDRQDMWVFRDMATLLDGLPLILDPKRPVLPPVELPISVIAEIEKRQGQQFNKSL